MIGFVLPDFPALTGDHICNGANFTEKNRERETGEVPFRGEVCFYSQIRLSHR